LGRANGRPPELEPRARELVDAVAAAAARWREAAFPPRVRAAAAVVQRTGYSPPVVAYALDRLFGAVTRAALEATISGELGSLEALDGFVARKGRPDVWFRPAGNVVIISSDTTIGVALHPLVFAICAKAQVLVKDRDDGLIAAFLETLAQEGATWPAGLTAEAWSASESTPRLADADVVIAFGRDEALRAIRAALPVQARFLPFGHRISAGYLTRHALAGEQSARRYARAAALDALLYDGEGCLSLRALFVERGGRLRLAEFAGLLAVACAELTLEFPPGARLPDPRVARYRNRLRFRAAQGAGELHCSRAGEWLVAFDPPPDEPPPLLPRTLAVYPVETPEEAAAYLRRHLLPLEALATDQPDDGALCTFVHQGGAARIARFGTLQDPPLGGEHGGCGRILPFVRAIYRS
jgi:hypothetical protein